MNTDLLRKPFPPEVVRHRPGRHGESLAYIPGSEVIARLNEALDPWSFSVVQHEVLHDEVVVLGRLTAEGIVKEAFGSSSITRSRDGSQVVSLGDDLKAAATDALKKGATLLGVALHLYTDSCSTEATAPARAASPRLVGGRRESENGALTHSQLRAIHAIARRLGWNDSQLGEWLHSGAGVHQPDQLDKRSASTVIDRLQEALQAAESRAC